LIRNRLDPQSLGRWTRKENFSVALTSSCAGLP
jgi:hypothetical protein